MNAVVWLLVLVTFWMKPQCPERIHVGCLAILLVTVMLIYFRLTLPSTGNGTPLVGIQSLYSYYLLNYLHIFSFFSNFILRIYFKFSLNLIYWFIFKFSNFIPNLLRLFFFIFLKYFLNSILFYSFFSIWFYLFKKIIYLFIFYSFFLFINSY